MSFLLSPCSNIPSYLILTPAEHVPHALLSSVFLIHMNVCFFTFWQFFKWDHLRKTYSYWLYPSKTKYAASSKFGTLSLTLTTTSVSQTIIHIENYFLIKKKISKTATHVWNIRGYYFLRNSSVCIKSSILEQLLSLPSPLILSNILPPEKGTTMTVAQTNFERLLGSFIRWTSTKCMCKWNSRINSKR